MLLASSFCPAQTEKLTIEPAATTPLAVDDRPLFTEWSASVTGPGLIEGRLELSLIAEPYRLATIVTDELVISGQEQKVRIVFPPQNWPNGVPELLVDLKLHTATGTVRLDQKRLRTSSLTGRKFPLLIGETRQRPRSLLGRDRLSDLLRFEALFPEEFKDRALTVTSHLAAEEFPQEPLTYCHFEVIAVPDDVFTALRPAQIEALLRWVRAGGSLYLEPKGILESSHLDFLNELADGDPRNIVFTLDDKGRVPKEVYFPDDDFLFLTPGLGAAVLGQPADLESFPEQQWRRVHAALWKIRDDQREEVLANGTPSGLRATQFSNPIAGVLPMDALQVQQLSSPPMADVVQDLVDWLRPRGVKMVPLWVIGSILTMLVVLIGPVDYVVLSRLKRRKWTWITFPVTVVAMTLLTMSVTNAYLSSAESRREFILHDVDSRGEIVRTNRFELVFASATRDLITSVQGSLFAPLFTGGSQEARLTRAVGQANVVYYRDAAGRLIPMAQPAFGQLGYSFTPQEPIDVEGRVPSRYRARQKVRQWTPQLNRTLSFAAPADAPAIDWAALGIPAATDLASLQSQNHAELLQRVRAQFGPLAELVILASQREAGPQDLPVYSSRSDLEYHGNLYAHQGDGRMPFVSQLPFDDRQPTGYSPQMIKTLIRLTAAPPLGLSLLAARTSPHGGRSLDDIPLHVSGAADSWWLAILVPQGDDLVVYRQSHAYSR